MQFDKEQIVTLHRTYEDLKEHMERVWNYSRQYGDFHSIYGFNDDSIIINVETYSCGETEIEQKTIPFSWVAADNYDEVIDADMARYRAEQQRIAEERRLDEERKREQSRIEHAERVRQQEIETLRKLQAKYPTINQGETP